MTIYQDYSSVYDTSTMFSGFLTMIFGGLIVSLIILVILCIARFKIFKKTGNPGWYALIPIFNQWKFLEISGLPGWLVLIPIANVVCMFVAYYKLAIKFGKSSAFSICTVLFPMVCLMIIAFDKSTYDNKRSNSGDSNSVNAIDTQVVSPVESNNIQPVINEVPTNEVQQVTSEVSLNNDGVEDNSNNI